MKRLTLFLMLFIFAFTFIACEEDTTGPSGPGLDVPSGLEARALSDNQVLITWQDSSYIETGFRIQRSKSGSESWVTKETGPDTTYFTDTDLNEGTKYLYRVKSLGRDKESEWSDVIDVTTFAKAPTELTAVMDSTVFTTVKLTWTDNSEKETGFQIHRKLTNRGDYEEIATVDSGTEEYQDTALVGNQVYYYLVRAMVDSVGSIWSNEVFVATTILTPRPPSNLTASASISQNIIVVRLRWNDNSTNNDGFIIERSLQEDAGFEFVNDLEYPNLQSYPDSSVLDETPYYYRMAAYNSYGNSNWSNVASVTTPLGPPEAPSNLRLTDSPTFEKVHLAWNDNSADETGFILRRETETGGISDFQITANVTILTDSTVEMSSTYIYKVKSLNNSGASAWSDELEVTTPDGPPRAPRITELTTLSISEIRIIWEPNRLGNHDGFYLERKSEHENVFSTVGGEFGPRQYVYQDTDLEQNTWYTYRLYAFNDDAGRSPYSEADSTQTWTTTVFSDGFEDHEEGYIPGAPWDVTERGGSTARVSTDGPHAGQKFLQFMDTNPIPEDSASVLAIVRMRPVTKGTASCWLKLASEGFFAVRGGDPRGLITFQAQFNANNTITFQNGGAYVTVSDYPTDEWFQLSFIFDCRTQIYNAEINGQPKVTGARLQRADSEGSSGFILVVFNSTEISYADVDEIQIDDTIDNGALMYSSNQPPAVSDGDMRIDEAKMIVGPVR